MADQRSSRERRHGPGAERYGGEAGGFAEPGYARSAQFADPRWDSHDPWLGAQGQFGPRGFGSSSERTSGGDDRWQQSYAGVRGERFGYEPEESGASARLSDRDERRTFRGRGPKGYRRSDERIREDACELLTEDDRIDASNVEVAVSESEVTLTGTVNSRDEKRRAEDLAERISGVRDVHNHLRIVNEGGRG